jgi:hypothetical protein
MLHAIFPTISDIPDTMGSKSALISAQMMINGAIPIEVSVLCMLRREENSPYRLLLVV